MNNYCSLLVHALTVEVLPFKSDPLFYVITGKFVIVGFWFTPDNNIICNCSLLSVVTRKSHYFLYRTAALLVWKQTQLCCCFTYMQLVSVIDNMFIHKFSVLIGCNCFKGTLSLWSILVSFNCLVIVPPLSLCTELMTVYCG